MDERTERLRRLMGLEVRRILRRLQEREAQLVELWSKHRAREPFVDTLFARWATAGVTELTLLSPEAIGPLSAFHDAVDDLRFYLRHTDDMPTTLGDRLRAEIEALEPLAADALRGLGESAG